MKTKLPESLEETLRLVMEGKTHKEMAIELVVTPNTINTYIEKLKQFFTDEEEFQQKHVYSRKKALLVVGKRYFDEIYDNAPSISPKENRISEYFQKPSDSPQSSSITITSSLDLVEDLAEYLGMVTQLRQSGNPEIALQRATRLTDRLREVTELGISGKYILEVAEIREKALIEKLHCTSTITMKEKVARAVKPIVKELKDVASEFKSNEIGGLSSYWLADAHYLNENYESSMYLLVRALEDVHDIEYKMIILRQLALDWAYLGNELEFLKIEESVKRLINSRQFESTNYRHLERACQMYEGIGRGRGILGLSGALETLEEGKRFHNQLDLMGEKAPVLLVQISTSMLEVMLRYGNRDIRAAETIGAQGKLLASIHGYPRHKLKIDNRVNLDL